PLESGHDHVPAAVRRSAGRRDGVQQLQLRRRPRRERRDPDRRGDPVEARRRIRPDRDGRVPVDRLRSARVAMIRELLAELLPRGVAIALGIRRVSPEAGYWPRARTVTVEPLADTGGTF